METLQYLLLHLYIYIYMETLFTFTMYLQDSQINFKKNIVHIIYIS